MPTGLVALLDDIAGITKLAAASLDDIGAAAGKAGVKAAGVVVDDAAVTPRYVTGFTPDRELPIIAKIAWGSIRNKLLLLLPAALVLSAFLPWAITPLLMIGGSYLAYEGAEKLIEAARGGGHEDAADELITDPKALEDSKVKGAIRTDLILSAEIMAIALGEVANQPLLTRAIALAAVAVLITVGVYGVVGLIVKMDDIGLHLARRRSRAAQGIGRGLVLGMPIVMRWVARIGTAAMLWVGGGILVHGLEVLGVANPAHTIHAAAHAAGAMAGPAAGVVAWMVTAVASGIVGLLIGGMIAVVMIRVHGGHE